MSFKAFLLKEHVAGDPDRIDSQVIILYDAEVETFFYYGTRKSSDTDAFVIYNGEFHYERLNALSNLLYYSFNTFEEVVTHELHNIEINNDEYFDLDFNSLKKKISIKTEIAAYDRVVINKKIIIDMLDMLISHEK
jgi:hypothetical protein